MSTFLLLPLSTKCSCWLWNISAWLYTIRLEGGLLICVFIFWLPNKHVVSWLTHCKYSTNVYWMYWSPYPSKLSRIHLLKETIFPLFSLFFFSFSCSIFSLKKKNLFLAVLGLRCCRRSLFVARGDCSSLCCMD